ncbi:phospholipase A2-like [Osmia lignaria lignaria]|uniref:phospholipase A2-like n=1 Tax=Osmia lignaria lignaria TaxID=1437193 RepID=UPI00402B735F
MYSGITMSSFRIFLLFILFLLIVGFGKCDNTNNETLKETYVSPIEKSIRLFMRSGRTIREKFTNIKEEFKEVVFKIPLLKRNPREKNETMISSILNPIKSKIKAIFPGTYWCGDGDISPNKEDLGFFETADACCKAHDSCPDGIPAEGIRDGLLNNGIFTRSPCDCDDAFYRCLKDANNIVAFKIGATYFNILKPQCFKKYLPVDDCTKYPWLSLLNNKCDKYTNNYTQPETLEWCDSPKFTNM